MGIVFLVPIITLVLCHNLQEGEVMQQLLNDSLSLFGLIVLLICHMVYIAHYGMLPQVLLRRSKFFSFFVYCRDNGQLRHLLYVVQHCLRIHQRHYRIRSKITLFVFY